jgi:hypothetical protein
MKDILGQIAALSRLAIKVGIFDDAVTPSGEFVAEYAAYNEYGTASIPARPFIRGYIENNSEKIKSWQELYFKQVSEGKITADAAAEKMGKNAKEGIKHYIKTPSNFVKNADSTKARKKPGSYPLIDTGLMRGAVNFKVESI